MDYRSHEEKAEHLAQQAQQQHISTAKIAFALLSIGERIAALTNELELHRESRL